VTQYFFDQGQELAAMETESWLCFSTFITSTRGKSLYKQRKTLSRTMSNPNRYFKKLPYQNLTILIKELLIYYPKRDYVL